MTASTIAYLIKPADGELVSGDAVLVREEPAAILLAVIDVLGHGPIAATAAAVAIGFLKSAPITRAITLMHGLHDALRGTRGAAATLCVLHGLELDACGVGNVEARVVGSRVPVVSTPGIVGGRVGTLREASGRLHAGDRVVCWSDGISARFDVGSLDAMAPTEACAHIMAKHRRPHDDASILIADLGHGARGRLHTAGDLLA